jgi:branched-chain amino acid transport system permease protein
MEMFVQVIVSGILMGGIYALISLGLTLIFGVIRIINFAHGEYLMLSMYATYWLYQSFGIDPYISIFIVAPSFFVFGYLSYLAVIKPILKASAIMQVFATVGLSILFVNIALFLWSPNLRVVKSVYKDTLVKFGFLNLGLTKIIAFTIAIGIAGALFSFLKYSMTGKAIRAIVQDRTAARLMGINVSKLYGIAMGIGIALVGAAGALIMPIYPVFPNVGLYFVVVSFVVVVLGGLGDMWGAMVGGLLIGIIESLGGFYFSPAIKDALYLLIFLVVLILRPGGLFGMSAASEVGMR